MRELDFDVTMTEGGFLAECPEEKLSAEAATWEELRTRVREAIDERFLDQTPPRLVRLRLVREEVLAVG